MFNLSVVLFTIPIVKDIGISDIDIALIYTVLPFTVFIAPPLVGFLADRLGITDDDASNRWRDDHTRSAQRTNATTQRMTSPQ